ncbi:MAG: hypothetical protein QXP94_04875 [Thermofilaceae archaeon]
MTGVKLWRLSDRQLSVLTYPAFDRESAARRLVELSLLGVDELAFEGPVELWGLRVIAKGTVGIVVKGRWMGVDVAVKVRRLDANRPSLLGEAEKLRLANKVGVGPRLLAASRNFLVWKYIEGALLEDWGLKASEEELKAAVGELIRQALALDKIGLVHQELSRLGDHVLVTPELGVVIFDFETASLVSGRSNVTQVIQGLMLRNTAFAKRVREVFGVSKEEVLRIVREYKVTRRSEALEPLLGDRLAGNL